MVKVHAAEILEDFIRRHPDSKSSLALWLEIMQGSHLKHFPGLKAIFGAAYFVKPFTIFNISGNKYRLIAVVSYSTGIVAVDRILTHQQYDRWNEKRR